ncbi:hypothetical protein JP0113_05150 [Helicobacter pylori]|nr:hypothetical protein JP0113_05150 [Helicobacter pylori]
MTNITPEAKNTNRHSVLSVEKEGRNLARKYHQVLVEELPSSNKVIGLLALKISLSLAGFGTTMI